MSRDLAISTVFVAQLFSALAMLAHGLPRRRQGPLSLAVLLGAAAVAFALPWVNGPSLSLNPLREVVVFTAILGAMTLAVLSLWDVGVWPALFCSTAGYTMQNLASSIEFLLDLPALGLAPDGIWFNLLVTAATYACCYLLFARKIDGAALRGVGNWPMLVMFAVVSFVVIGFDVVLKNVAMTTDVPAGTMVVLRVVHLLVCAFVLFSEYEVLYARGMHEERAAMERLLAEREAQYARTRESMEAVEIRLHDIRHWIRHYADGADELGRDALEDIAREVSVYDTAVKTGSAALDAILSERCLVCERQGIRLNCMADGSALEFMRPTDLYTLFGNALDNATEAAAQEDPERRIVSLSVRRTGQMAVVSVQNYCQPGLVFSDGLPLTTKDDGARHGFGMRSMRQVAERYGGSLQASEKNGVFCLDVLLAMPEA